MAMDFQRALRAMDDDKKMLEELAIIFSEDAPAIALDFEEAVGLHDSKSARIAIHSLKGLTASFYDIQAVEKFASLEQSCVEENWKALEEARGLVSLKIEELIADMHKFAMLSRTSQ